MIIPLGIIREMSGDRNLGQLQAYLEVKMEQVRGAIASLSMLSTMEMTTTENKTTDLERVNPEKVNKT